MRAGDGSRAGPAGRRRTSAPTARDGGLADDRSQRHAVVDGVLGKAVQDEVRIPALPRPRHKPRANASFASPPRTGLTSGRIFIPADHGEAPTVIVPPVAEPRCRTRSRRSASPAGRCWPAPWRRDWRRRASGPRWGARPTRPPPAASDRADPCSTRIAALSASPAGHRHPAADRAHRRAHDGEPLVRRPPRHAGAR